MGLIFLDFDGVLNRCTDQGYLITRAPSMLEHTLVQRVASLVDRTDAQVVLSTMWREQHRFRWLRKVLQEHGLPSRHVVGMTPILPTQTRGQEIATYLGSEAKRFVVLDDNDTGGFDMTPVRQHLVKTTASKGFTAADLLTAQRVLTHGPVWEGVDKSLVA